MLKAYKIDFRIEYLIIQYQNIFSDENKNLRERIKLIKEIAETKDSIFFNFLQYIIITEIEFDIRIAALKRIHYFKNKIDLKSFFEDLINHKKRTINEPFFSISLYYINESWATDLIDKKIITEISTENEVWDSNSTESLDSETEDLFFKISYFFEYNHFRSFIITKNFDKLYKAIRNSDLMIYKLQCKKLLDLNEELTPKGITFLERYIGLY